MLKLHLQGENTEKNTAKKIVEKQKQIAKKIRFPFGKVYLSGDERRGITFNKISLTRTRQDY